MRESPGRGEGTVSAPSPSPEDFEEDPRYRVAMRELGIALLYWAAFTVVVSGTAWLLGGHRDPTDMTFVLGFPAWFFWSVLVSCVGFSIIPYFLVRYLFTDIPLSADGTPDGDEKAR